MTPWPPSSQEVERQIFEAFSSQSRAGGVSWGESVVHDMYGSESEKMEARAKDKDSRWQDLVDDPAWRDDMGVGGFCFLDAVGFAYYIAAAMVRVVRANHDEGSVAFHLTLRPDPSDYTLGQWSRLSSNQCEAISKFLRRMAIVDDWQGRSDWYEAYWSHWHQFDPEPLPEEYKPSEYGEVLPDGWIATEENWEVHPRYGNQPRFTGLNPLQFKDGAFLGWHGEDCRIPGTAITANPDSQVGACVQITHFFDHGMHCADCGRAFIFFAEEQKFWYETLKMPLDVNCIRCLACRKAKRDIAGLRATYEQLLSRPDRTVDDDLELTNAGLSLVEDGVFQVKSLEKIRATLNRLEGNLTESQLEEWIKLEARSKKLMS